jgi:hypothetical protein
LLFLVVSGGRFFALVLCFLPCFTAGCAQWKPDEPPVPTTIVPGLPEARVPDAAAIIEVAFINPEPDFALDETLLSPELRSILAANGIRAGRAIAWEPTQVLQNQEAEGPMRFLNETNVASDFEKRRRKLSCRDHQPYALLVRRSTDGELSTLVRTSSGTIGHSLVSPQFGFILQTRQMDDGRIAIRLTPEIQHGEMKQNFVASESLAFRMDFNRSKWTIDELVVETPLSEGQALVIMPSAEAFGLGEQMFMGTRADQTVERVALIVHLQRRPIQGLGQ